MMKAMGLLGTLLLAPLWGSLPAQEPPRPDRHPLLAIFPDPLPDGRTSVMVEFANQFLRTEFEHADQGRTYARIDGEDWGLTLDLAQGLGPIVLNLRLRGVWRSGGFTDRFFAVWHKLFALPGGGRNIVPNFRLDYTLERDGRTIAQLARDRACLMDVDLAVLYPFGDRAAGGRLGASVQAPVGKQEDFSGSGGWDCLVGAALWKTLGGFTFHTQLERAFLGIGDDSPYAAVLDHRTQNRAWAGVTWRGDGDGFFGGLGLDASIGYTESPYSVGVPRIDSSGWQQHWTFSHTRLPKWRVGISEEAGTYTSPDLTVFVQYKFSVPAT
jgi:hypothetical protein